MHESYIEVHVYVWSSNLMYMYVHTTFVGMCSTCFVYPLSVGEKMDADTMDEKRKEHMAYEYLCHLEEAKK